MTQNDWLSKHKLENTNTEPSNVFRAHKTSIDTCAPILLETNEGYSLYRINDMVIRKSHKVKFN